MSNRLSKRERHKVFERELRALERRREVLWQERFVTIELEKPLFAGYEKYFVFRTDVVSRKDFPLLNRLFPLIDAVASFKTKKVTLGTNLLKNALKEKGKKTVDVEHKTKDLQVYEWARLTEREQSYFFPTTARVCGYYGCKLVTVYRWLYPWMLVSKMRKTYVTSLKVKDLTIEAERDAIERFVEQRDLEGKIGRMMDTSRNYHHWNPSRMRYRLQEKQIMKEVRHDLAWITPSVKEDFNPNFDADFSIKTIKPKYSGRNNSAFLLILIHKLLSKIIHRIQPNKPIISRPIRNFRRAS
jgi:hypothetical protein